jgi:hypothetical protein
MGEKAVERDFFQRCLPGGQKIFGQRGVDVETSVHGEQKGQRRCHERLGETGQIEHGFGGYGHAVGEIDACFSGRDLPPDCPGRSPEGSPPGKNSFPDGVLHHVFNRQPGSPFFEVAARGVIRRMEKVAYSSGKVSGILAPL